MRAQPVDRRVALLRQCAISAIGKAGRLGACNTIPGPDQHADKERSAMALVNATSLSLQARQVMA